MIDPIGFRNAEQAHPLFRVHRGIPRQGKDGGVVFPPQEYRPAIYVKLAPFHCEFTHSERDGHDVADFPAG